MLNKSHIKVSIYLFIFLGLFACKNSKKSILTQTISNLNSEKKTYETFVFIALDPECPLSQSYTKKINFIFKEYNDKVLFINFIPGNNYSVKEINVFVNTYNLTGEIFIDKNLSITEILDAQVVPECFVLNKNLELIYKGLIDDWVGEIGKTKQYINKDYLIDAIESSIDDNSLKINSTTAIGCIIER